jgi:crotonobetainyl-CoA:carnitine CoA-transferase CaiB-like acyl-CoA transferase
LEIDDPELGNYKTMGFVPKFSKTPCAFYRRAPRLGENTEEVLKDIAEK